MCTIGCDKSVVVVTLILFVYLWVLCSTSAVVYVQESEDYSWEPVFFFTMWVPEITRVVRPFGKLLYPEPTRGPMRVFPALSQKYFQKLREPRSSP